MVQQATAYNNLLHMSFFSQNYDVIRPTRLLALSYAHLIFLWEVYTHTHLVAVAQHDYEDKEIDSLKDRGCWFGNHAWFICQNARFYKSDTACSRLHQYRIGSLLKLLAYHFNHLYAFY